MDFIFMLTRSDQTVEDCLEVLDAVSGLGIGHLGFKDIGVELETLKTLNRAIKQSGAISYMEVVSTTPEDCLRSARAAVEIGVDRLLGGSDAAAILNVLAGSGIAFYPFPGLPIGHPTLLGGAPEQIAEHCRDFLKMGCAGADLLAFRAIDAEPLELIRAAREALGSGPGAGELICAGSIDSAERIGQLKAAGVDAFTIGSAAFDGSFSPSKGLLRSQLRDIVAAC
ncbi:MAG: 4-hydroxythreonine-4-phosphate dehydrogenase [Rhodovibrionaceae bacterium]